MRRGAGGFEERDDDYGYRRRQATDRDQYAPEASHWGRGYGQGGEEDDYPRERMRGDDFGDEYAGYRGRGSRGGRGPGRERGRAEAGMGREGSPAFGDEQGPDSGNWYYGRSSFSYPALGGGSIIGEAWEITGPHAGKGPKGYRRSNEQITEEASQRLQRHGRVDATEIEVSCEDGILTLRGTVDDRQSKRMAEDCVESIFGVEDVVNELRIRRRASSENRSDMRAGQSSKGGSETDTRAGQSSRRAGR